MSSPIMLAMRIYAFNNVFSPPRPQDQFVLLLRDPVDRFISAFEWDLHSKSRDGTGRDLKNRVWQKIYDRFKTANDLAEALSSSQHARRDAAQFAMTQSQLHMAFDLGWYVPPLAALALPAGRTHVLRTHRLSEDMLALSKTLGLTTRDVPRTKNDYKHKLPQDRLTHGGLSDLGRRNLIAARPETTQTLEIIHNRLPQDDALTFM